ncbi:hypothetical protein MTO96_035372 [Rhipicephalus appendiculatus]
MLWMGQLDLDRPCGAGSSDGTCWLCEDFPAWNTVIHALDLELLETAPGTLCLRFDPNSQREDLVTAASDASIVVSSLLSHHVCIQELDIECAMSTNTPAAHPSFPVLLCRQSTNPASRSLRSLRVRESASLICSCFPPNYSAHLDLRDMDAIIGLETLYIHIGRLSQRFAVEMDALLERNRNTLKSVEIFEDLPGQSKLSMV